MAGGATLSPTSINSSIVLSLALVNPSLSKSKSSISQTSCLLISPSIVFVSDRITVGDAAGADGDVRTAVGSDKISGGSGEHDRFAVSEEDFIPWDVVEADKFRDTGEPSKEGTELLVDDIVCDLGTW